MTVRVDWSCHDCGIKHGRDRRRAPVYRNGICDICRQRDSVIEAKEYGIYQVKKSEVREAAQ